MLHADIAVTTSGTINAYCDQDINIRATVETSSCDDGSRYRFVWTPITSFPSTVDFKATTSSAFYVPAFTLDASTTYGMKLTLQHTTVVSRSVDIEYQFTVRFRPLVAAIAGGSESEVPIIRAFSISAAPSMDPNEPSAQQTRGLTYTWSCSVSVDGTRYPCLTVNGTLLNLPKTAILTIPESTLPVTTGEPYMFTVSVGKPGRVPVTASKFIYVSPDPIPMVSLQPHASLRRKSGDIYINTDDQVIFRGTCDSSLPVNTNITKTYKWIVQDAAGKAIDFSNANIFTMGSTSINFVMLGKSGLITPGSVVS